MATKSEIQVKPVDYYLTISGRSPSGEKVHAEYDSRNGELKLYVYAGEVIRKAFYDDDNTGKVNTYFLDGVPTKRQHKRIKKREVFLDALVGDTSRSDLNNYFKELDADFRRYKSILNVDGIIASHELSAELSATINGLADVLK